MHFASAISFFAVLASLAPTPASAGGAAAPIAGGILNKLAHRQTNREQVVRRQTHSRSRAAIQARAAAAAVQSASATNPCGGPSSFNLQFSGSGYTDVDGKYASASVFSLASSVTTCNLYLADSGRTADASFPDASDKQSAVFMDTNSDRASWGGTPGVCKIASEKLACYFDEEQDANEFSVCWSGEFYYLNIEVPAARPVANGCEIVTVNVVKA